MAEPDLERWLREHAPPVPPASPELRQRVLDAIAKEAPRRHRLLAKGVAGLAAAAALFLFMFWERPPAPDPRLDEAAYAALFEDDESAELAFLDVDGLLED